MGSGLAFGRKLETTRCPRTDTVDLMQSPRLSVRPEVTPMLLNQASPCSVVMVKATEYHKVADSFVAGRFL